uniref:Uncharacterized protein LOC105132720 n=1 Tax=Rhizophora mucronata TaxID=61149 RepID=A0A2P2IZA7_RHIMU
MGGAASMRLLAASSWPLALTPQTSPRCEKSGRVYCSSPHVSMPPSKISATLSLILNSSVIACLRASSAEIAYEAATAALSGGISVLEIVMSTPGVFQVVKKLVQHHPAMTIGVGTVLSAEDALNAMNAGAKFLMSPAMVKDIMDEVQDGEVLYIPGVMTPTEILSAYGYGAKIVKVYPVSALGGVQYMSALKKPFPHIPMVASQGITIGLCIEKSRLFFLLTLR